MRPTKFRSKRNDRTEAPSNLLFFDSETYSPEITPSGGQKALRLRLWCAIAGRLENGRLTRRVECRGTTADEFWAFVDTRLNRQNPLWMWCHNAAADWTWCDLWGELLAGRIGLGPFAPPRPKGSKKKGRAWRGRLVIEGRPNFLVGRRRGATLKAVDSGNYWQGSLAAIGESYGLPKGTWPGFESNDQELSDYCLRDCEVLERAVCSLLTWWRREDCGVFQLSAPALALTNWKHTTKCLTPDGHQVDVVWEPNADYHRFERAGYYGPRFEAFYEGLVPGPVYKADVNSCYLSVMEDNLFPRAHANLPRVTTPDELRRRLCIWGAVANVRIASQTDTYPWRPRKHPMQLAVCGQFWTTLVGPELVRALDAGHVVEVGRVEFYEMHKMFRGWARTWHNRKIEAQAKGDIGHADFCKLFGVSLTGKFGQHGTGWRDRLDMGFEPYNRKWVGIDRKTDHRAVFRGVAGVIQQYVEGDEPGHCSPIISAYISAYAREHMRWSISKLPLRSVYYVGSDALVLSRAGAMALSELGLIHPTEFGLFKLSNAHADGEIVGTNHYRLGGIWTRSGVHGKPKVDRQGRLISERWENMPALASRAFDGTVRFSEHEWTTGEPRPKGRRGPDGWLTPFRLSFDREFSDFPSETLAPWGAADDPV